MGSHSRRWLPRPDTGRRHRYAPATARSDHERDIRADDRPVVPAVRPAASGAHPLGPARWYTRRQATWLTETMRRASWDDRSWWGIRNVRIAAAAMAPRLEMTLHRSVCIQGPDRCHPRRLWHLEIGGHLEAVEVAVAEASGIGLVETDHELLGRGPEGFPQVCGNRPELGMLPDRADPPAACGLWKKRLRRMQLAPQALQEPAPCGHPPERAAWPQAPNWRSAVGARKRPAGAPDRSPRCGPVPPGS